MTLIELKTGERIKSKHPIIKRRLREKIISGEYTDRIPSLRTLSSEFGVSIITLNKAIDELVKEKLLVKRAREGIFVKEIAHLKIPSIGLVGNPKEKSFFHSGGYYDLIFDGVHEEVLQEQGTIFSYQIKGSNTGYRKLFRNHKMIDGMLIFTPFLCYKENLLKLGNSGFPFIVVGSTFYEPEINYVDSDDVKDSFMATEYLIKTGHKRIAFFTVDDNSKLDSKMRFKGYSQALKKYRLKVNSDLVCNAEKESILKLFSLQEKPTALFAAFVGPLTKSLLLLREKKISLPQDFNIVTYDDYYDQLSQFGFPYAVVEQPLKKIGRMVAEKLFALIKGKEKVPIKINLRSKLVFKEGKAKSKKRKKFSG